MYRLTYFFQKKPYLSKPFTFYQRTTHYTFNGNSKNKYNEFNDVEFNEFEEFGDIDQFDIETEPPPSRGKVLQTPKISQINSKFFNSLNPNQVVSNYEYQIIPASQNRNNFQRDKYNNNNSSTKIYNVQPNSVRTKPFNQYLPSVQKQKENETEKPKKVQPIKEVPYLRAQIKKVVYCDEKSGWSVLKVVDADSKEAKKKEIQVVGALIDPQSGEFIEVHDGKWVNNKDFGKQIVSKMLSKVPPTTEREVRDYLLKSFKGIGPALSIKIVTTFGMRTLDVFENTPEELKQIGGFTDKKIDLIITPYKERVVLQKLVNFLSYYGLDIAYGHTIWKKYKLDALSKIMDNPFEVVGEVRGFSFSQADKLSQSLNMPRDSPKRIIAGLKNSLFRAARHGHCSLPWKLILFHTSTSLEVPTETTHEILEEETENPEGQIKVAHFNDDELPNLQLWRGSDGVNFESLRPEMKKNSLVFNSSSYELESNIAQNVARLVNYAVHPLSGINIEKDLNSQEILELSSKQIDAVKKSLTSKVLIITGGPGVGKTLTISRILSIYQKYGIESSLCAPTGRAAVRLQELCNYPASTVHRLLGSSTTLKSGKNQEDPLTCKLLVIDEFSMMDLQLTNALLEAVPSDAVVIIVGDADQLPSVGPGQVLYDLIKSKMIETIHLTEIFRQGLTSSIIRAAHTINSGEMPDLSHTINLNNVKLPKEVQISSDFCFIEASEPSSIIKIISELVVKIIPSHMGLQPSNIQVLTPLNKRELGSFSLNSILRERINPPHHKKKEVQGREFIFREGDKVMQIINDYDKNIFNGETGMITKIIFRKDNTREIRIRFERCDEDIIYDQNDLDQIVPAYAVTIHKSQGNEFPVVIIAIHRQHRSMLQRNLLYTAITRGKKLVILVGEKEAVRQAVISSEIGVILRYTNLAKQIQDKIANYQAEVKPDQQIEEPVSEETIVNDKGKKKKTSQKKKKSVKEEKKEENRFDSDLFEL